MRLLLAQSGPRGLSARVKQHYKRVNVCVGGGPARCQAHDGAAVCQLLPEAHLHAGGKLCVALLVKRDKHLVGLLRVHELAARGLEGLGNSRRLRNRPGTNLLVEAIIEQRLKLDARDHSLGEKDSAALHEREEVGAGSRLGEDNRLAEKRPALGAANVERVGKAARSARDTSFPGAATAYASRAPST